MSPYYYVASSRYVCHVRLRGAPQRAPSSWPSLPQLLLLLSSARRPSGLGYLAEGLERAAVLRPPSSCSVGTSSPCSSFVTASSDAGGSVVVGVDQRTASSRWCWGSPASVCVLMRSLEACWGAFPGSTPPTGLCLPPWVMLAMAPAPPSQISSYYLLRPPEVPGPCRAILPGVHEINQLPLSV